MGLAMTPRGPVDAVGHEHHGEADGHHDVAVEERQPVPPCARDGGFGGGCVVPRCSLAPGRIACRLAGAIIHCPDGAWLAPATLALLGRTPFTATATTAAANAWALPVHRGSFISCLRRSCGDVTMVFVFVAVVSHSSYKSKNLCRLPVPCSRVPNRTLSSSQAMRVTCKCIYADARWPGCGCGVPWREGRRRCEARATGRWQGLGGGMPRWAPEGWWAPKVEGWRAVGPQGKRRPTSPFIATTAVAAAMSRWYPYL